jgi:ATP-dependent DNA helicase RecG
MTLSIFDEISNYTTLNPFHMKLLEDEYGNRAIDMLLNFPKSYIKRKFITKLREITESETVILKGIITEVNVKNNGLSKILIEFDGAEAIEIIYFRGNRHYLEKLYTINTTKIFSGKMTKNGYKWQMIHPEFVFSENRLDEIPENEAIYNLPKGILNSVFSKLITQIFDKTKDNILNEWLDEDTIKTNNFPSFIESLKILHNPDKNSESKIQKVKERLVFDELLANQIGLKLLKISYKSYKGRAIKGNGKLRNAVLEKLNFQLTNDQNRALKDIYRDQGEKLKMVRMLQGDVGSGKTIVALLAMLNVIEVGFKAVLMVPTEILAQQHFESISSILQQANLDVEITLLTSASKKKKKLLEDLENNKFQIIIGTHAVFQEKVKLNDVGLIIIDEQHRFGVTHRASLSSKDEYADLLFMSATPIPRSLSLVHYGYMDHSLITEKPKNRLPVITNIVSNLQIGDVLDKIDEFILRNEKIYWIMEYCDGGTLRDKINMYSKNEIKMQENLIWYWSLQILSALKYIHTKCLIHRDLKPDNIYIENKTGSCKIGDFGLSKVLTDLPINDNISVQVTNLNDEHDDSNEKITEEEEKDKKFYKLIHLSQVGTPGD